MYPQVTRVWIGKAFQPAIWCWLIHRIQISNDFSVAIEIIQLDYTRNYSFCDSVKKKYIVFQHIMILVKEANEL